MTREITGYDVVSTLAIPLDNFDPVSAECFKTLSLEVARQNAAFCQPMSQIYFDLKSIKSDEDFKKIAAFLLPSEVVEFTRLWNLSKELNVKRRQVELESGGDDHVIISAAKAGLSYAKLMHHLVMNEHKLSRLIKTAGFRRDACIPDDIVQGKIPYNVLVRLANYYFANYEAGLKVKRREIIDEGGDRTDIDATISNFANYKAQYQIALEEWVERVNHVNAGNESIVFVSEPGQSYEKVNVNQASVRNPVHQAQRSELLGRTLSLDQCFDSIPFDPIKENVKTALSALYPELSIQDAAQSVAPPVVENVVQEVHVSKTQFIGYSDDKLVSTYKNIVDMIQHVQMLLERPLKFARTKFLGLLPHKFSDVTLKTIKDEASLFLSDLRKRQVTLLWEMQARMAVAVNQTSAGLSFNPQQGLLYNSDTAEERASKRPHVLTQKALVDRYDDEGQFHPVIEEHTRTVTDWLYDVITGSECSVSASDAKKSGQYRVHSRRGLTTEQFKSYQEYVQSFIDEQERVKAATVSSTQGLSPETIAASPQSDLQRFLRGQAQQLKNEVTNLIFIKGVRYYTDLLFSDAFSNPLYAHTQSVDSGAPLQFSQDRYKHPAIQELISIPSLRILLSQLSLHKSEKVADIIRIQGIDGLVFKDASGKESDIFNLLLVQAQQDYKAWKKKHLSFFSIRTIPGYVKQLSNKFDKLLLSNGADERNGHINKKLDELRKDVFNQVQKNINHDLDSLWNTYRKDAPNKPRYEHHLENYLCFVRLKKAMRDVGGEQNPTGFFTYLFKELSKKSHKLTVTELGYLRNLIQALAKQYSSDYFTEVGLVGEDHKSFLKQCDVMLEVLNVCELKVSDRHVTSLLSELNEAFPDNNRDNKAFLAKLGVTYLQEHFLTVSSSGVLTFNAGVLEQKLIEPNVCLYLLKYSTLEDKDRIRELLSAAERLAEGTGREQFIRKYIRHLNAAEMSPEVEGFIGYDKCHREDYGISGETFAGACANDSHLLLSINIARLYQVFTKTVAISSWEQLSKNCYTELQVLLRQYVAKFQIIAQEAEAAHEANVKTGRDGTKPFRDCLPQRHTMIVNLLAAPNVADDYAFSLFKYFLNGEYFFESVPNTDYYKHSTEKIEKTSSVFRVHIGYEPPEQGLDHHLHLADALFIEDRLLKANNTGFSIDDKHLQQRIDNLLYEKINACLLNSSGDAAPKLNIGLVKIICRYGSLDVLSHMHRELIRAVFERTDCFEREKRAILNPYVELLQQLRGSGRVQAYDYNIRIKAFGYTTLVALLDSKFTVTEANDFTERDDAITKFQNFYAESNKPLFELLGNPDEEEPYIGINPFERYQQAVSYASDRYCLQQSHEPDKFNTYMDAYLDESNESVTKSEYAKDHYGDEYARRMALFLYRRYLSDDAVLISEEARPLLAHFFKSIEDSTGHKAMERREKTALCNKRYKAGLLPPQSDADGTSFIDQTYSQRQLAGVWSKARANFDEKIEMDRTVKNVLHSFMRVGDQAVELEIEKLRYKPKTPVSSEQAQVEEIHNVLTPVEETEKVLTPEQAERKLCMLEKQFLAKIRQCYHRALLNIDQNEDCFVERALINRFIKARTSPGMIVEHSSINNLVQDDFSDPLVRAELEAMADIDALKRKQAAVETFLLLSDDYDDTSGQGSLSLVEARKNRLTISILGRNTPQQLQAPNSSRDRETMRTPSVAGTTAPSVADSASSRPTSYDLSGVISPDMRAFFAGPTWSPSINVNVHASSAKIIYDNKVFCSLSVESAITLHNLYSSLDRNVSSTASDAVCNLQELLRQVKSLLTKSQCATHPYVTALEMFLKIVYYGASDEVGLLKDFTEFHRNTRFLVRQLARGDALPVAVATQLALEEQSNVYLFKHVLRTRYQNQRSLGIRLSPITTTFLVPVLSDLASRTVNFDVESVNEHILNRARDADKYQRHLKSVKKFFTSLEGILVHFGNGDARDTSSFADALKDYVRAVLSVESCSPQLSRELQRLIDSNQEQQLIDSNHNKFVLSSQQLNALTELLSGKIKMELPIHIANPLKELLSRKFNALEGFLRDGDENQQVTSSQLFALQSLAQLLQLMDCHTDFDCDLLNQLKVRITHWAKVCLFKQCFYSSETSSIFSLQESHRQHEICFAAYWLNVFGSDQDKADLQVTRKHLERLYINRQISADRTMNFQIIGNAVSAFVEGTSAEENIRENSGETQSTVYKSRIAWLQQQESDDLRAQTINQWALILHASPTHDDYVHLLSSLNAFFASQHSDIHLVVEVMVQQGIDCITDIPLSRIKDQDFFDYMSDLDVDRDRLAEQLQQRDLINLWVAVKNAVREMNTFSEHDAAFTYQYASKTAISDSRFKWARNVQIQLEKYLITNQAQLSDEKCKHLSGLLDRAIKSEASLLENVVQNDLSLPHHYLDFTKRCLASLGAERSDLLILAEQFSKEMVIDPSAIKTSTLDALIENYLQLLHKEKRINEGLYSRLVYSNGAHAESFDKLKSIIILENQLKYVKKFQVARQRINEAGLQPLVELLRKEGFSRFEDIFYRGSKPTNWFMWYSTKGRRFQRAQPQCRTDLRRLFRDRSDLRQQVNFLLQKKSAPDFLEICDLPCQDVVIKEDDSNILMKTLSNVRLKDELKDVFVKRQVSNEQDRKAVYQQCQLLRFDEIDNYNATCFQAYQRLLQYITHKEFSSASALLQLILGQHTPLQLSAAVNLLEIESVVQYATLSHENDIEIESLNAFNSSQLASRLSTLFKSIVSTITVEDVVGEQPAPLAGINQQVQQLAGIVSGLSTIQAIGDETTKRATFERDNYAQQIERFFEAFCRVASSDLRWKHCFGLTQGAWTQIRQKIVEERQYGYDAVMGDGDVGAILKTMSSLFHQHYTRLQNMELFFKNLDEDVVSTKNFMRSPALCESSKRMIQMRSEAGDRDKLINLLLQESIGNIKTVLSSIALLPTKEGMQLRKELFSGLSNQQTLMPLIRAVVNNASLSANDKVELIRNIVSTCVDVVRKFSAFEIDLFSDIEQRIVKNIIDILTRYSQDNTSYLELRAEEAQEFFNLCIEMVNKIDGTGEIEGEDETNEEVFVIKDQHHFDFCKANLYQMITEAIRNYKLSARELLRSVIMPEMFNLFSENVHLIEFEGGRWVVVRQTAPTNLDLQSVVQSFNAHRPEEQLVLRVYRILKLFEGRIKSLRVGTDEIKQEKSILEILSVEFTRLRTEIYTLTSCIDASQLSRRDNALISAIADLRQKFSLSDYFQLWKYAQAIDDDELVPTDVADRNDTLDESSLSGSSSNADSSNVQRSSTATPPSIAEIVPAVALKVVPLEQSIRQNLLSFLLQCLRRGKFNLAINELAQHSFLRSEEQGFKISVKQAQTVLEAALAGIRHPYLSDDDLNALIGSNTLLNGYLIEMLRTVVGLEFSASLREDVISEFRYEANAYDACMKALNENVIHPINKFTQSISDILLNNFEVEDYNNIKTRVLVHLPHIYSVINELTARIDAIKACTNFVGVNDQHKQNLIDELLALRDDLRRLERSIHPSSSYLRKLPDNVTATVRFEAFTAFNKEILDCVKNIKEHYKAVKIDKENSLFNLRGSLSIHQRLVMNFDELGKSAAKQQGLAELYNRQLARSANQFIQAYNRFEQDAAPQNLDETVQYVLALLESLRFLNENSDGQGNELFLDATKAERLRVKLYKFICHQNAECHFDVIYVFAEKANITQLQLLKDLVESGGETLKKQKLNSPFESCYIGMLPIPDGSINMHSETLRKLYLHALSFEKMPFYSDQAQREKALVSIKSVVTLLSMVRASDDRIGRCEDEKLLQEAAIAIELKSFIDDMLSNFYTYFSKKSPKFGKKEDFITYLNLSTEDRHQKLPAELQICVEKNEWGRIVRRFNLLCPMVLDLLTTLRAKKENNFESILEGLCKLREGMCVIRKNIKNSSLLNTGGSDFLKEVEANIELLHRRESTSPAGAQSENFHSKISVMLSQLFEQTRRLSDLHGERITLTEQKARNRTEEISELQGKLAVLRSQEASRGVWSQPQHLSGRREYLETLQKHITVLEAHVDRNHVGNDEIAAENIRDLSECHEVLLALLGCTERQAFRTYCDRYNNVLTKYDRQVEAFEQANVAMIHYFKLGQNEDITPADVISFSPQYLDYGRKSAFVAEGKKLMALRDELETPGAEVTNTQLHRDSIMLKMKDQLYLVSAAFASYAVRVLFYYAAEGMEAQINQLRDEIVLLGYQSEFNYLLPEDLVCYEAGLLGKMTANEAAQVSDSRLKRNDEGQIQKLNVFTGTLNKFRTTWSTAIASSPPQQIAASPSRPTSGMGSWLFSPLARGTSPSSSQMKKRPVVKPGTGWLDASDDDDDDSLLDRGAAAASTTVHTP